MEAREIHGILTGIGATHLHHANTVATSCTLLEYGGLLSRGFVESSGLKQTAQSSDPIDKKYLIWDHVFLDHVDIHGRAGRVKGPNQYGPVLFVFDLSLLLNLPEGSEISVAKSNPIYWQDGQPDSERWFQSADELANSLRFGDFEKMLVILTPSKRLDFPNRKALVVLDDPHRATSAAVDAYGQAVERLKAAAAFGNVDVSIFSRLCRDSCTCGAKYAELGIGYFDSLFAPL